MKKRNIESPEQPMSIAPEHLSDKSKEIWDLSMEKAATPIRQVMLQMALECLDRADECRELIDREGLTVISLKTGMSHCHPLLRVEKESRQLFAKIMGDLKLNLEDGFHL